jgi:uncharacterized protein YaaQ
MKMIIAIIRDIDEEHVTRALTDAELRVTCIASTGGFFRRGNSTLLIGLEEEQVDLALQIIHDSCSSTVEYQTYRATIFVLNVNQHIRF